MVRRPGCGRNAPMQPPLHDTGLDVWPDAIPVDPREPSAAARLDQLGTSRSGNPCGTARPYPATGAACAAVCRRNGPLRETRMPESGGQRQDRAAYWILHQAIDRGEIGEETTMIESSSGNFAMALAAFTRLVGLRFIPVIDPNISSAYESFLRRLCPTVVKVERRDEPAGSC